MNLKEYPDLGIPSIRGANLLYKLGLHSNLVSLLNQIVINYNLLTDTYSPSQAIVKNIRKNGNFSLNTYKDNLKKLIELNILIKLENNLYRLNKDYIIILGVNELTNAYFKNND